MKRFALSSDSLKRIAGPVLKRAQEDEYGYGFGDDEEDDFEQVPDEYEEDEIPVSYGVSWTKREIKENVQSRLLLAMAGAFSKLDADDLNDDEKQVLYEAMDKQMGRVERLFGYDSGTFSV